MRGWEMGGWRGSGVGGRQIITTGGHLDGSTGGDVLSLYVRNVI